VKVQALEVEVVAREKRLSDFEVISNRQRGASRDLGMCVYHTLAQHITVNYVMLLHYCFLYILDRVQACSMHILQ
jgi:hypothetical protein